MNEQLNMFGDIKEESQVFSHLSLDLAIERLNIENVGLDFLAEKVKKQKNGINYIGCCPFHKEKTPSFQLKVKENRYICYGCRATGGPLIIPFVLTHKIYPNAFEYFKWKIGFREADKEHQRILIESLKRDGRRFGSYNLERYCKDFDI